MFNKLIEAVKGLSMQDKYLVGVSLAIVVNPTFALIVAVMTLTFFIWQIGKQIAKD